MPIHPFPTLTMTSITMNNRKRWLRAEGGKGKKKRGNRIDEENPKGNGT